MAGLLDYDKPDPLTLGLLGFSQAIGTPRSRGGGVAAALGAFPAGQMQAAEMQRQREQDMLRQQVMQAQIGKYQFDMDTSRATAEAAQGEQQRLAQLGQWIQTNKPELFPAFQLDPKSVAAQLLPQKPGRVTVKPGEKLYEDGKWDAPLVTGEPRPAQPTELEKLMEARDKFPPGSPNYNWFNDAIRKQSTHAPASTTNVMTGQIVPVEIDGKPGYVMPGKDGTVVPIPGIAPTGTQKAADASKSKTASQTALADRMIGKVDEALENVSKWTTGVTGGIAANIPGTAAVDFRSTIETIRANLGFQELQAMREASPTGGALGAIAVQELVSLQSTVASLDPRQSPDTIRRNLQQIRKHVEAWRNAVNQANRTPGQSPGATGGWSIQREQ